MPTSLLHDTLGELFRQNPSLAATVAEPLGTGLPALQLAGLPGQPARSAAPPVATCSGAAGRPGTRRSRPRHAVRCRYREVRDRITGCTDSDQLDRWITRAAAARTVEDLVDDAQPT